MSSIYCICICIYIYIFLYLLLKVLVWCYVQDGSSSLVHGIGSIMLISGHFNRRVLYLLYNTALLYFTIHNVILLVQYYINVLYEHTIQYISQVLPDCGSCVPDPGSSSQSISRFWVVFLSTLSASLVQKNLRTANHG